MGAQEECLKQKESKKNFHGRVEGVGWEEPMGSQEQEKPDLCQETSQEEAPGWSQGREELV